MSFHFIHLQFIFWCTQAWNQIEKSGRYLDVFVSKSLNILFDLTILQFYSTNIAVLQSSFCSLHNYFIVLVLDVVYSDDCRFFLTILLIIALWSVIFLDLLISLHNTIQVIYNFILLCRGLHSQLLLLLMIALQCYTCCSTKLNVLQTTFHLRHTNIIQLSES